MNIGATGRAGEDAALAEYLRRGFTLTARNFQTRWGEIDLIVTDGKTVVFCEVKTRTPRSRMKGVTAMTLAKKRKIFRTALLYMQEAQVSLTVQPRFDVAEIDGHWAVLDGEERFLVDVLRLYENAFGSEVYDGFI